MRGFDIFMEVAHEVSKVREDVHFVIAGLPKTSYGSELLNIKEASFKEYVLKQHPFDLNRFHFLDWIPETALRDLFRISDCHFYWTVPFTLSWSLFQSLATGCLVLASNTSPVHDGIVHEKTGILCDQYDRQQFVDRMLDMLDNPQDYAHLREAGRQSMIDQYSFDVCLPKLAEFYMSSLDPNPSS